MRIAGAHSQSAVRAAVVASLATALAACGSTSPSNPSGDATHAAGDKVKLAVIIKSGGGSPYFTQVAKAAKAEADNLGVDLILKQSDDVNDQLSAIDAAITQGAKGIALGPADPSMGPAVVSKANAAGVKIIASSDAFQAADGTAVPVVTISGAEYGEKVGEQVADYFTKAGWDPADPNLRVISMELPKLQTCNDRTNGSWDSFSKAVPAFPKDHVVHLNYDGSLNSSLTSATSALSSYGSVKKWLVWSCNDEGVIGPLKALANRHVPAANVIGVGLGGGLACTAWNNGEMPQFKASLAVDPSDNGASDVKLLYDWITKGATPPEQYNTPPKLVTPDDYEMARQAYGC
jgi:L-arabinose transport system substrate-binding protein